ncbi:unnamed protein product [Blepharisma stoltei]|uniref:Uncharacterized protein n=1 Tax=Blepharisma stoltei TaxID=1481888 RepID=A0AAU9IC60_9CILI|nr:unnamed protein product [Blepharisma stoltei]
MDSPPPLSNSQLSIEANEAKTPQPKRSILKSLGSSGSDLSFVKDNASPKREKITKGREMWLATKSRKDFENKLQTMQNRINHLKQQKEKSIQHIEICKKKHEIEQKFKNEREEELQKLMDYKLEKYRELEERKKHVQDFAEKRKLGVQTARERLIKKNRTNNLITKEERKEHEEFKKKMIEEEQEKAQERAKSAIKQKRVNSHRKNTNSMLMLKAKEDEFHQRIESEAKVTSDVKKKLEELEMLEKTLIEELQETKVIEELELSRTLGLSFFSVNSTSRTSRDN